MTSKMTKTLQNKFLQQKLKEYCPIPQTITVSGNFLTLSRLLLIIGVVSVTAIPIEIGKNSNIQSKVVTITPSTGNSTTSTIAFTDPMLTPPSFDYTFLALDSYTIYCNYYVQPGQFGIFTKISQISPNSSTSISVQILHTDLQVKHLKLSILIFSNSFDGLGGIQSSLLPLNLVRISQIALKNQSYIIVPHLFSFQMITRNSSNIFQFQLIIDTLDPLTLAVHIDFTGFYQIAQISYRFLLVYKTQIAWTIIPEIYQYNSASSPSSASITYIEKVHTKLFYGQSAYLFGANRFAYQLHDSIGNRGVAWINTYYPSNHTTKIELDNYMRDILYEYIIFNSYYCKNNSFPFKSWNSGLNKFQCTNGCTPGKFQFYFPNSSLYGCISCIRPCLSCNYWNHCITCVSHYQLAENNMCVLSANYYTNNGTDYLCSTILANCDTCDRNGTTCLTCVTGFSVDVTGTCIDCSLVTANCLQCTNTLCLKCSIDYVLISELYCKSINAPPTPPILPNCTSSLCEICHMITHSYCMQCKVNSKTVLVNGNCQQLVCGDGKIDTNETCDDGNALDFDGCSGNCLKVEDGFKCNSLKIKINQTFPQTSKCYYSEAVKLTVSSISKILSQNKVLIKLKNSANKVRAWSNFTQTHLSSAFKLQFPSQLKLYDFNYTVSFTSESNSNKKQTRLLQQFQSAFNPADYEILLVYLSYFSQSGSDALSLNHQPFSVSFSPSTSNLSIFQLAQSYVLQHSLVTDNNHIVQYYDQKYYSNCSIIFSLSLIVSISIVIMLIGSIAVFFIDNKRNSSQILMALEVSFIVQFTYFSLMGIGQLNPLFVEIALGLKYSSGYDFQLSSQQNQISRQLSGMGIQSVHISDNYNLSIIIPIVLLFCGSILAIVSKFKANKLQPNDQQKQKQTQMVYSSRPISQKIQYLKSIKYTDKDKPQQKMIDVVTSTLIGNFSFGLFLFFHYKFLIFSFIQLQQGSMSVLDVIFLFTFVTVLMAYILLLFIKSTLFLSFTQKLKSEQKTNQINLKNQVQVLNSANNTKKKGVLSFLDRINIAEFYPLFIIFTHLLNSLVLSFSLTSTLWNICPILFYLIQIILLIKLSFYDPVNKIRFILNNVIGIIIQAIFMFRHYMASDIINSSGFQEKQLGEYFPFTIVILLLIMVSNTLIFFIYSIKRIRCCKLEIQWTKQTKSLRQTKKQLLQNSIKIPYNQQEKIIVIQTDKAIQAKILQQFDLQGNSTPINLLNEAKQQQNDSSNDKINQVDYQSSKLSLSSQPTANQKMIKRQIRQQLNRIKIDKTNSQNVKKRQLPSNLPYLYTDTKKYVLDEEYEKI